MLIAHTAPATSTAPAAIATALPHPGHEGSPLQSPVQDPHQVRDSAKAQQWLDKIRTDVLGRFPNLDAVRAAGYFATRTDVNGPTHYTLGGYTNPDPTKPDGGTTDFTKPFSIIVENGAVVGVMLRANGATPDFGAGTWHSHGEHGDDAPLMHVWFNRPLDKSFGGHLPGFSPEERLPGPVPQPQPQPQPLPQPSPSPSPPPHPHPHPSPQPLPQPLPQPNPDPEFPKAKALPIPIPPDTPKDSPIQQWLPGGCSSSGC
jgi:hypothetical protein